MCIPALAFDSPTVADGIWCCSGLALKAEDNVWCIPSLADDVCIVADCGWGGSV